MSVAFRRDSDEEHREPQFELLIPAGPNLVTARGLELIRQRILELQSRLDQTGDPAARTALQRDLRYWETRQINAELAPLPIGNRVEFGTQVSMLLNGKSKTFRIVGDDEADPSAGAISFNAPLSRAILGAEAGDALPFGDVDNAIEILRIDVPRD